ICAKHLFAAATTVWYGTHRVWCSLHPSLTGHLNRGVDGVFKTVRVVRRHLVSIAEVHAIVARAHLAQGEPKMSRDRFGFLERHGFAGAPLPTEPLLSRFARRAGFVTLRQTFVRRCHSSMLPLGSGEAETGDARSRDGGVREELARAKQTTLESKP